jgi:SAM-dependent methyltransferase
MGIQQHFNEHTYPAILWRFPLLIKLIHAWNMLLLQRNWACQQELKLLLPALPPGGLVVDAGCGDGQYIFPYFQKFPRLRFWGFDKNKNNISFCEKYSGDLPGGGRLAFFSKKLEELHLDHEADLLLCIGTLQYIAEDGQVLQRFFRALKPACNLLVYVPVNGRAALPFYPFFFKKLNHYEKCQSRKRVYSDPEISGKLAAAGFHILKKKPTYGTLGIAAHETYSLLLMGMANAAWWWAWLFPCLLLLLLPIILIFKQIDYRLPKKSGNGLLILAQKPMDNTE